jgi:hypothetical protein
MAPPNLALDLPQLDLFARRLDKIDGDLDSTKASINAFLGHDYLGGDVAQRALHDFERGWKDGRTKISKELQALAKMAHSVVDEMTKTDQTLAQAIDTERQTQQP